MQYVSIKPEWQDEGDNLYTWAVIEDNGDRLIISPIDTGLSIPPQYNVTAEMIVKHHIED